MTPGDDRGSFSCGEPALDRFFRHYAGQNQFKLRLSVTHIAVLDGRIPGFVTVVAGSLEKRDLPDAQLRRRLPSYPLPVLRLARLGVEQSARGTGLGRQLVRHVFLLALQRRDVAGCMGVVTDAKPDAISFYEKLGFVSLEGVLEGRLHSDPLPMFLDIHSIAAALEASR